MTKKDISKIEKMIERPLPDPYKWYLLDIPSQLRALLELREADEQFLFIECDTIIRWNTFFRAEGYSYENSYGEICQFPHNHVVIGANLGGDFYHLNCDHKRTRVLLWNHETGEIEPHTKSLREFILRIFEVEGDLAVDGFNH